MADRKDFDLLRTGEDSITDVVKVEPNEALLDPSKTKGRRLRDLLLDIVDTLRGFFERLNSNEIRGVDPKVKTTDRRDALPARVRVSGMRCAVTYNTDQGTLDSTDPSLWPGPAEYFLLRDSNGPVVGFEEADPANTTTTRNVWVRSDGSFTEKLESYPLFVEEDYLYQPGDIFKAPIPYPSGSENYLFQVKRPLPRPGSGGFNPIPTGDETDDYLPFTPISQQSYDDTAILATLAGHGTRLGILETNVSSLETRQNSGCVLVAANHQRRYYAGFMAASQAMTPGETLLVFGYHGNGNGNGFFANYAPGTIWLAPGAVLNCHTFYCHTDNLSITGFGTIEAADFSIEPVCTNFFASGIEIKGTIGPYGYGFDGPTLNHVFYNCRLDGLDQPVYNALYKSPSGSTSYANADFMNCRITTTASSVFNMTDTKFNNPSDPAAAAGNRLRIVGNVITAPAGAVVVDDSKGSFTFEQGVNTYVNVAPPTKAAAANVVSFPSGGGSYTPPPAPVITNLVITTPWAMPNALKFSFNIEPANAAEASYSEPPVYYPLTVGPVADKLEGTLSDVPAGDYPSGRVKLRAVGFPASVVSNVSAVTVAPSSELLVTAAALHFNTQDLTYTTGKMYSAFAEHRHTAPAGATSVTLRVRSTLVGNVGSLPATSASVSVYLNNSTTPLANLAPAAYNVAEDFTVSLPGTGTQNLRVVFGATSRANDAGDIQGTVLERVSYTSGTPTLIPWVKKAYQRAWLSDSTGVGFGCDYPAQQAALVLLRNQNPQYDITALDSYGGKRALTTFTTPTGWLPQLAPLFGASTTVDYGLFVDLLVNDAITNAGTPTQVATALGAGLDAAIAAYPALLVTLANGFLTTSQEAANAGGFALQAYRDAVAGVVSGRPQVQLFDAKSVVSAGNLHADGLHIKAAGNTQLAGALSSSLYIGSSFVRWSGGGSLLRSTVSADGRTATHASTAAAWDSQAVSKQLFAALANGQSCVLDFGILPGSQAGVVSGAKYVMGLAQPSKIGTLSAHYAENDYAAYVDATVYQAFTGAVGASGSTAHAYTAGQRMRLVITKSSGGVEQVQLQIDGTTMETWNGAIAWPLVPFVSFNQVGTVALDVQLSGPNVVASGY